MPNDPDLAGAAIAIVAECFSVTTRVTSSPHAKRAFCKSCARRSGVVCNVKPRILFAKTRMYPSPPLAKRRKCTHLRCFHDEQP
jgi:hypothetical protein